MLLHENWQNHDNFRRIKSEVYAERKPFVHSESYEGGNFSVISFQESIAVLPRYECSVWGLLTRRDEWGRKLYLMIVMLLLLLIMMIMMIGEVNLFLMLCRVTKWTAKYQTAALEVTEFWLRKTFMFAIVTLSYYSQLLGKVLLLSNPWFHCSTW
jgi:hypothetical protein